MHLFIGCVGSSEVRIVLDCKKVSRAELIKHLELSDRKEAKTLAAEIDRYHSVIMQGKEYSAPNPKGVLVKAKLQKL